MVPQYLGPKSGDINTAIIRRPDPCRAGQADARRVVDAGRSRTSRRCLSHDRWRHRGPRCRRRATVRRTVTAPALKGPPPCRTGSTASTSRRRRTSTSLPFFLLFGVFGAFPLVYTAWVSLHEWSLLAETHTVHRPGQLPRAVRRPVLLERAVQHAPDPGARRRCRSCCWRSCLAHVLNQRLRGADVLADERAAAEHHQRGRGRDHLRPAVRPGLRAGQLGARCCSASGRSTGRPATASSQIAISVMIIWRWTGYNALIYLAAMQAVPQGPVRRRVARRRDELPAAAQDHRAGDPADDHLHRHRLDDRRHAGPRRAAAVRRRLA